MPNLVEENPGNEVVGCSRLRALGSAPVIVVGLNILLNMDEREHQLSQSYIDLRDLHPHPWGKGSRSSQPGDSVRLNLVLINTYQGHRELTARCLISSSNTSGIVEVHEKSDLFISG